MPKQFDRKAVRVSIYYLIALAFSFLARFSWHTSDPVVAAPGAMWNLYWHQVSALGPFLGALAIWAAFRPERSITFGGTWPAMGLCMLAVPALVLGVLGVDNGFAVERHVFGAHLGLWIVLYGILEETGWRGYLQGEFANRAAIVRYVIVGLFWYAWHFSWLIGHSVGGEAAGLAILLLASVAIGFVAERTRSIFAAAALHAAGNIFFMTADFRRIIPSIQTRGGVALACLAVWLVMLRLWRIRDKRIERASASQP